MSRYGEEFKRSLKIEDGAPFTRNEVLRVYEIGFSKLKQVIEE